jgi:hypothetical protein
MQSESSPSPVALTVTLSASVITAVKVTPHATDATSLDFQRRFAGSSGTPKGFNAAIQRIRHKLRLGVPSHYDAAPTEQSEENRPGIICRRQLVIGGLLFIADVTSDRQNR